MQNVFLSIHILNVNKTLRIKNEGLLFYIWSDSEYIIVSRLFPQIVTVWTWTCVCIQHLACNGDIQKWHLGRSFQAWAHTLTGGITQSQASLLQGWFKTITKTLCGGSLCSWRGSHTMQEIRWNTHM